MRHLNPVTHVPFLPEPGGETFQFMIDRSFAIAEMDRAHAAFAKEYHENATPMTYPGGELIGIYIEDGEPRNDDKAWSSKLMEVMTATGKETLTAWVPARRRKAGKELARTMKELHGPKEMLDGRSLTEKFTNRWLWHAQYGETTGQRGGLYIRGVCLIQVSPMMCILGIPREAYDLKQYPKDCRELKMSEFYQMMEDYEAAKCTICGKRFNVQEYKAGFLTCENCPRGDMPPPTDEPKCSQCNDTGTYSQPTPMTCHCEAGDPSQLIAQEA